jgi:hypothetical protein
MRLVAVVMVILLLAVSVVGAFFYSELTKKRDILYRVEYELLDALGFGLVAMENNILVALDEPSREVALNQSWMVYHGDEQVYWSVEALLAEYGVSSEEHRVLENLQHAVAIVSDAFREWIEMPLWKNVTRGDPFLLDSSVEDAFRNTVGSMDVVRLEVSIYENEDHPYSRLSLIDFELVDDSTSKIIAVMEDLGSPP